MRLILIAISYALVAIAATPAEAANVSFNKFARMTIQDFFGQQKFADAFRCGDQAEHTSSTLSCELVCTIICVSECADYSAPMANIFRTESCSENRISIYSDTGLDFTIEKERFESEGMSWLPVLLDNLHQFLNPVARVEVETADRVTYQIEDEAGGLQAVPGLRVEATVYPKAKGEGVRMYFRMTNQGPGLKQILSFKSDDFSSDVGTFFQLKGLKNANPAR